MSEQLRRELLTQAVPAMATGRGRVALGPPFKTATGQWVVLPDGSAEWVGLGAPTPGPGIAMLDKISALRAAHVPDPPPLPQPNARVVLRALVKLARGKAITAAEGVELDRAEA